VEIPHSFTAGAIISVFSAHLAEHGVLNFVQVSTDAAQRWALAFRTNLVSIFIKRWIGHLKPPLSIVGALGSRGGNFRLAYSLPRGRLSYGLSEQARSFQRQ
jgi:hypothetical protein